MFKHFQQNHLKKIIVFSEAIKKLVVKIDAIF